MRSEFALAYRPTVEYFLQVEIHFWILADTQNLVSHLNLYVLISVPELSSENRNQCACVTT